MRQADRPEKPTLSFAHARQRSLPGLTFYTREPFPRRWADGICFEPYRNDRESAIPIFQTCGCFPLFIRLYIIIDKAAERTFCRLAFYSSCRFAQTLFRQTPSGTVYPSSMSQTRPPQSGRRGGRRKATLRTSKLFLRSFTTEVCRTQSRFYFP